jgi:hypothetical protein
MNVHLNPQTPLKGGKDMKAPFQGGLGVQDDFDVLDYYHLEICIIDEMILMNVHLNPLRPLERGKEINSNICISIENMKAPFQGGLGVQDFYFLHHYPK